MTNKKKKSLPKNVRDREDLPNLIDIHVGTRLKKRRTLLGMSQEKLAEAVGVTFQQIQKYERAKNRISASRLYQFSKILEIPTSYFFENFTADQKPQKLNYGLADNEQEAFAQENIMDSKETMDLVRVYYSIPDPKMRKDLFQMIKTMAKTMKNK